MALQQARERYETLLKDGLFDRAKRLRNDVVAHNLIPDTPTPKVQYEDVYDLRDAAERIVTDLFAACVRDKPSCLALRAGTDGQAKLFWDTYERGTVNARDAARPRRDVPPARSVRDSRRCPARTSCPATANG